VPIEPCETAADEKLDAATDAPLTPGTTQFDRQLAADELHSIMQVVTADVTVEVSGVIGVDSCADTVLALKICESTIATADARTIARTK
jgi:hypothetical protein